MTMEHTVIAIALVTFGYLFLTSVECLVGLNFLKNLSKQKVMPEKDLPTVSIIFSALNEQEDVEGTLHSLLALKYPKLEIIAINDRSTDATPQIMDRFQKEHPEIKVIHLKELPEGWLGKNHALYYGSKLATGEWLLFTDADVMMKSDTLTKTLSFVTENHLDHLTIYEHHLRKTFWLRVMFMGHYLTYTIFFRPWRIRFAWSKRALGHGAFNLINAKVYRNCGGHEAIALECLDDMKLGELVKLNGYKQDTLNGRDYVEREWYHSLPHMIKGWEKNNFAFFDYKILPFFFNVLMALLFFIWPVVAVFFFPGPARWLNIASIALTLVLGAFVAVHFRIQKRYTIFYPIGVLILIYSAWNSFVKVYRQNGVVWRGTHYSLKELKNRKALN
jgi:glycosyltransferase involved in cell wall biosynthesis